MDVLGGFLELLHADFHGIGYLLVVIEQDFLADNLRDEETRGLVGELVLAKVGRAIGQQLLDAPQHGIDVETIRHRKGDNLCVGQQLVPLLHQRLKVLLVAEVYFINKE